MNLSADRPTGSVILLLLRALVRLVVSFAIWGGLLFGSAGNLDWLRGWLHIGIWLVTFAINGPVLLKLNRDVLTARMRPKWSSENADTILLMLFMLAVLAVPLTAGLDIARFGWSSQADSIETCRGSVE